MPIKYCPSVMCADFWQLGEDIAALDKAGVDLYHVDIMDGHFVPNLMLNLDLVKTLRAHSATPLDVHLMVTDPAAYIEKAAAMGADYVSFHLEASDFPLRVIRAIKQAGMKAGVAVNPKTRAQELEVVADTADFILVMSVEPGFAGQQFIPSQYEKIRQVRALFDVAGRPEVMIEVDGAISLESGRRCIEQGADALVLGTSAVFGKPAGLYAGMVDFRAGLEQRINGEMGREG